MSTEKHNENYYLRLLLKKMKIKEVMSHPAISIDMDAPFSEVPRIFNQHSIRHLPVVNKENKLVGLMTQKDLYQVESPRRLEDGSWYYDKDTLDNVILKTVMVHNPLSLHPDDTIGDALSKMVEHKYGCIPIVDEHELLCGIIVQVDILKLMADILNK